MMVTRLSGGGIAIFFQGGAKTCFGCRRGTATPRAMQFNCWGTATPCSVPGHCCSVTTQKATLRLQSLYLAWGL
jgi:hypothetical protein